MYVRFQTILTGSNDLRNNPKTMKNAKKMVSAIQVIEKDNTVQNLFSSITNNIRMTALIAPATIEENFIQIDQVQRI